MYVKAYAVNTIRAEVTESQPSVRAEMDYIPWQKQKVCAFAFV